MEINEVNDDLSKAEARGAQDMPSLSRGAVRNAATNLLMEEELGTPEYLPPSLSLDVNTVRILSVALTEYLEKCGVVIEELDNMEPGRTSQFDGQKIQILKSLSPMHKLWAGLMHCGGHTISWISKEPTEVFYRYVVSSALFHAKRSSGMSTQELQVSGDFQKYIEALRAYELEAARYAKTMLKVTETWTPEIDLWLSRIAAADFRFVEHLHRTGETRPLGEFTEGPDADIALDLPIPALLPMTTRNMEQIEKTILDAAGISVNADATRAAN